MFDRFSTDARRVMIAAQDLAQRSGAPAMRAVHILAGAAAAPTQVTSAAFTAAGIDSRRFAETIAGGGQGGRTSTAGFDRSARSALELSLREALQLGHNSVEPEHLVLAVLTAADPEVAAALEAHRSSTVVLRDAIIDAITAPGDDEGPTPTLRRSGDGIGTPRTAGRAGLFSRRSGTSVLDQFGENLTAAAAEGRLDPVVGRDRELERVMAVLSRRTKNNPVLVGEPGVGKTAVVEGLAAAIAAGDVPDTLEGVQLYSIDLGSMVAGTRYRGDFEERIKKLLAEATHRDDVVLFLDEIHTVVGAGASEGALDAANILKPALARGEIRTIGATTYDEFRKHFERDAALERRFQQVEVAEPDPATAVQILTALAGAYARHHDVQITDDAVHAAVRLAHRHLNDRHLPDSAIDLLDEAGARLAVSRDAADRGGVLDAEVIAEVVAATTGVPVTQLTDGEAERFAHAEEHLARRVVGHTAAVSAVARAVRRRRVGLGDPSRPAGSFIFTGPTGVGKTELAKALAEFLFGSTDAMVTLDMSEYMEAHAVSRLIGAPPGYVGHDEAGQLTEAVRRRPYTVLLLDEIEKAHPDVFNLLLQLLDEGRLTDARGRVVDFTNTVVVMTSNLGTADLRRAAVGFSRRDDATGYAQLCEKATAALRGHFRPEFLNRVDDVVVFGELTGDEVAQIASMFLAGLSDRVAALGASLVVTDAAVTVLAAAGYDPSMGARPLRRVLQRLVEDPLSERVLAGVIVAGAEVVVDAVDGEVTVTVLAPIVAPVQEAAPAGS